MYQHLSETAKDVLKRAEELARQEQLEYVGTEHVLLAILDHGLGLGAQILENNGITLSLVKEQVELFSKKRLEETWVFGRLPGSPHFKQVIALAIEEAEQAHNSKVGTEFLLLALLREKGCIAERALTKLGLTLEQARQKVAFLQGRPR
jgi:ArsR family transcriptional regulator, arsenate/arsenite/antimonite-responsive transcriptional repressor / arsenate reductase (thioredoxin)